jgi:hypothetical protein
VQARYSPSKSWNIYTRFSTESKLASGEPPARGNYVQLFQPKQDWRTELGLNLTRSFELRFRTEFLSLSNEAGDQEKGFLTLVECHMHPPRSLLSGNLCLQYFETSGYASRIYVYENDVLYGLNLPAYYDKGYQYYMNLRARLNQMLRALKRRKPEVDLSLRWSQAIYAKNDNLGSGLDQIPGHFRTEWKFQIFFDW